MRKFLLLTMMCLFGLFAVNAQETITVGGENTTVDARLPFHTWWKYSYSQQIYTKSEINHGAANILKIAFFTNGTSYTRNVKVYMQNVTKSSFSSNEDWITVTDADLVFDGAVTTSSVMEITLDKAFEYTGKNLLLCIQDYTGNGIASTSYNIFEDNATRSIFIYDDDNLPGGENLTGFKEQFCQAKKNVLQITFEGSGETPEEPGEDEEEDETTLAAPVVTATAANDSTIVLTWDAVEGAVEYYIYEGEELIGSVTTLFCELRDLEANTNYCFTVTAVDENYKESEASEEACATTLDVAWPEEPGEEPEEPGDEPETPGEEPEEPGDEPETPGDEPEEPADSTLLAAPTNLRATIRQDVPGFNYKFEITMMWDAVVGAKGYDIYVNTADTTGFHMGYTNGTAYVAGTDKEATLEFYVVAFNDSIDSKPSEPCTITIVDDAIDELASSFSIYPNPVNDKLYIETLTQTQTLTVEIYDMFGRQQTIVNGQQTSCIDVTNLNSGIYFVKVVTDNGEVVKRFIKK